MTVVVVSSVALLLAVLGWASRAGRRADRSLAGLGYRSSGHGRWTSRVAGLPLVFRDDRGLSWTVTLPRYGTYGLRIAERAGGGMRAFGRGTFLVQDEALDARFVFASGQPSATLDLLASPDVREALLALPHVSLDLHADELVLDDPEAHSLAAADPGEVHRRVQHFLQVLVKQLYVGSRSVVIDD